LLAEGGRRVQIGSRALEVLTVLVERAGEVVSKDELICRVWQKVFVDVANLKTQVSALRRALGDGRAGRRFIVTVQGRRYNFVEPVLYEGPRILEAPAPVAAGTRDSAPVSASCESEA
jgi:DNA-binding winged helix-turn-helix (wHTH) protein